MVLIVGFHDQFTLDPTPDEELLWEETISDPGGTGLGDARYYHSPLLPLGTTNLKYVVTLLSGSGVLLFNANVNDSSDPDSLPIVGSGSSFAYINGATNSGLFAPVSQNTAIDINSDIHGESTEIGVNQYGQDPAIYGGNVSRATHVIFRNESNHATTVNVQLYGRPRGTRIMVPVPSGAIPGDRIVVILLFQLPAGGTHPYGINNNAFIGRNQPIITAALPPASYIRGDGSFAPVLSKQWWSDYTHNHDFTGAFGSNVTLDGSGEFLPREFEGGFTFFQADPDNGIPFPYLQMHHGDQQTNNDGITFSRVDTGSSRGSSGASMIVGSCRYREPALPLGWVEGDPIPPAATEFTFYLDAGKQTVDTTAHMTAFTMGLRNEIGTESDGAPYRRGNSDPNYTTVGSLFGEHGSDLVLAVNALDQPNPGEINTIPTPPPLVYLPADPTDLIITAFTYSGKEVWGNPIANATNVVTADSSNTRILSGGLRGYQQIIGFDPNYLGWRYMEPEELGGQYNSLAGVALVGLPPEDSAGRSWSDVDYDDSFWDVPMTGTNHHWDLAYPISPWLYPPNINPDGWWAHYAFPRGELFYFRMKFDIPDEGYTFMNGQVYGILGHAGGYVNIMYSSTGGVGGTLFGGASTALNRWMTMPRPAWCELDNNPWTRRYGYGGYAAPFGFGPGIIYGSFACYDQPHNWVNGINPPGLQMTLTVNKTMFDSTMISGIRDNNAHEGDPPVIQLSSQHDTVLDVNSERWALVREIYAQQAGSRALTQELYDYSFDQMPPFLPVPRGQPMLGSPFFGAPDVAFSFGTGFRSVWRDAGPGGLQFANRASSISFAG